MNQGRDSTPEFSIVFFIRNSQEGVGGAGRLACPSVSFPPTLMQVSLVCGPGPDRGGAQEPPGGKHPPYFPS